ncbi:uncharacterized protein LOC127712046 [Mytilus californianus]|uniref:uncharacterized protein LOC127712046 n=1 Tax=Mytilus californianus TaxID=6549 RepID=UPI002245715E|nr:uncharacterized protein LOC127712046 [Mytilus californianus]
MGILSCKSPSSTDVVHMKKTTPTMLDKKEETDYPEPTQGTKETDFPEPTQGTVETEYSELTQATLDTAYPEPTHGILKTKDASSQTPELRRSTRGENGRMEDEKESDSEEGDFIHVKTREASSQTPERQSSITMLMQEERDEDSALRSRSQCQSVATPKKIESN